MMKISTDRQRLIVVSFVVAVVVAVAIWATIVVVPRKHVYAMLQGHWLRFAAMTLLLWATLLKAYWDARKKFWFWIVFFGFVALHSISIGCLWATFDGFSTLTLALLGVAEWLIMALLLYWVTHVEPDLRPWRSRSRWVPTV